MKHLKPSLIIGVISFIVAIALTMTTFIIGPKIEDSINPIYDDVTATLVTKGDDYAEILITGVKVRSCVLFGSSTTVTVGNQHVRGRAIFLNKDGSELKIDQQRIGAGAAFVRLVRITPAGSHVEILTDSRCHPFWMTRTRFLDLDLTH